ncbi:Hypothetical_protein [Hexamita inflata]|uniref:Hypothetical_protein n=1 Tax=Hexamita inflata TaxID=28002 RepID=A0AA86NR81_9EUKA|nr:Hypothetical protein HINF_LOCUS12043 [Hexamita inflata]
MNSVCQSTKMFLHVTTVYCCKHTVQAANSWTCWLRQVDLLIKMSFPELSSDNHSARHNKHIQITTSMPYSAALSLRNGNSFCLKSCTQVTGHFFTNEDDKCQQKETATTPVLVRTERESTACFGQTSAVDAQVPAVTLMRLEDKAVHTKYKQFKAKSRESGQWT